MYANIGKKNLLNMMLQASGRNQQAVGYSNTVVLSSFAALVLRVAPTCCRLLLEVPNASQWSDSHLRQRYCAMLSRWWVFADSWL
jgi:hypothetical protein